MQHKNPPSTPSVDVERRSGLRLAAALSTGWCLPQARAADAPALQSVVLATPGPGGSVSAIPELAVKIGADRAEGLALRLKFVGGGIAIRDILSGNAQFGVIGISAAMNENLRAPKLVALAAVEDRVPLSLMVRADLKSQVRKVSDLFGRAVGHHSNSATTMNNGRLFFNLLLRQHGLTPEAVRSVVAGQSYDMQADALRRGMVDAVMSEEPFGLRMEEEGLAFALVRLGLPDTPLGLPGEGFLRGTLIGSAEGVEANPQLSQRMVRVVQRTLAWRRDRSAEEMVSALGLAGVEARALTAMLRQYPRQFSDDGRFSEAQIEQSERFFRESSGAAPEAQSYRVASMIVDRWAGRKP
jgi:ABC-type nitrate/sulfonate/bicarbonate transport system substrate-binding protein